MAETAKDYARKQLGNLDLSYLDKEREVANNIYNTSRSSLENNFNNLINQINTNRNDTRRNFNMGRSSIAENAYNANRANQADLVSRGIGRSGLKGLGEVGNRIETGRQYSNLANKFYNDMNSFDTTERQGRSQYDIDQRSLRNTLDQSLAGIDTRGADARNNYNMTLGQLAEGVQGRWDANKNAEAALAQQRAAAAQAHRDAVNAARESAAREKEQALIKIVSDNKTSYDSKVAQINHIFDISPQEARNILKEMGIKNENVTIPNKPKKDITKMPPRYYTRNMIGGWYK